MAKKTTTKKKTTASKKKASKKASVKKKSTTTKKAASKNVVSKKVAPKKAASKKSTTKTKSTTSKKPTVSKSASKKKTAGKKKAVEKKAASKTTKKKSTSSAKAPAKTSAKGAAAAKKTSPADRFRSTSNASFKAGQAAAAKLAAAAGIHRLQSTSNGDADDQNFEKLTKSPFSKRELRTFRELLLEKRAQLVGDVSSMESEALTGGGSGSLSHLPQHMADQGSDTYDQSLALDLAASQRDLLKEIDAAIDRIDANTFGICEMLGKPISEERLENTPWARFSIEAARRIERMGYRR